MPRLVTIFSSLVSSLALLSAFGCTGNCCCANPALGDASVQCVENLKMQNRALQLYATDYDDLLPFSNWVDRLKPYTRADLPFMDPALQAGNWGYAMNSSLLGANLAQLNNVDTIPTFFDSRITQKNAVGDLSLLPFPGRHTGLDNVAYLYGNIRQVRPSFVRKR